MEKFDNAFETSLFRKEIFTGSSTKYSGAVPNRYKFNMIHCLGDMHSFLVAMSSSVEKKRSQPIAKGFLSTLAA